MSGRGPGRGVGDSQGHPSPAPRPSWGSVPAAVHCLGTIRPGLVPCLRARRGSWDTLLSQDQPWPWVAPQQQGRAQGWMGSCHLWPQGKWDKLLVSPLLCGPRGPSRTGPTASPEPSAACSGWTEQQWAPQGAAGAPHPCSAVAVCGTGPPPRGPSLPPSPAVETGATPLLMTRACRVLC